MLGRESVDIRTGVFIWRGVIYCFENGLEAREKLGFVLYVAGIRRWIPVTLLGERRGRTAWLKLMPMTWSFFCRINNFFQIVVKDS